MRTKKAVIFCLTLLLSVLIFALANSGFGADNPGLNAKKIFEEGWLGYRSAKTLYEKETINMAIVKVSDPHKDWYTVEEVKNLFEKKQWSKKDRVIIKKEMIRYLKYDARLKDKMYIYFNFPPRDENTQFVIWRYPDKADYMWMYAPALRRNRRLAAADQEDHFMGSTFTYEDIRRLMGEVGQAADQFSFSLAKEEIINGRQCYAIEVRLNPAKKPNTRYGLRKFYREKKSPAFVRVEYFDKNGQLIKIQNNSAISYLKGLWRPTLVEMYEPKSETTTVLYWTEMKVGLDERNENELPSGVFTPKYMEIHGR